MNNKFINENILQKCIVIKLEKKNKIYEINYIIKNN